VPFWARRLRSSRPDSRHIVCNSLFSACIQNRKKDKTYSLHSTHTLKGFMARRAKSLEIVRLLRRFRLIVNLGHLPCRVLNYARRLGAAQNWAGSRADLWGLRSPDDNPLLRGSLIRFLLSRDQARQLLNQKPGDPAYK